MITGINESKTSAKVISCKCKCKCDGIKCISNQWWNNGKFWCECKKRHVCERDYIWNLSTCCCQNGKKLASIVDDSAITCDEVTESYDEEANFNKNKAICKTPNYYI